MFFARLSQTVIHHSRAIFILWLVALGASIPALLQVQNVIVYSDTSFNPKNSESSIAHDLVSREFQISQGESGLVVITGEDVRGVDARNFAITLNRTLQEDPALSNISNITNIYDIYFKQLVGYASVVNSQLYQSENTTAFVASLEYGTASVYANQWSKLVSQGPFYANGAQVAAYNQEANASSWPLIASQVPANYLSLIKPYYNLFYASWNQTFNPSSQYNVYQLMVQGSPQLRAQNITKGNPRLQSQPSYYNITSRYFDSSIPDPQSKGLFLSVAKYFNLYCFPCSYPDYWNNAAGLRAFTISTFLNLTRTDPNQYNTIGEIYDLGPSPSFESVSKLASRILREGSVYSYPVQPGRDVYSQFVSADNNTMLVILDFKNNGPDPRNSIQRIRDDVAVANRLSGQNLAIYVTGAPAFNYDLETESVNDIERIDPVTIVLIILIIGLFFGSLATPFVPISAIGLSIGVAFGLVYLVGTFVTSVHFLVLTLMPIAMLGAGTDYCIFLMSRYAEERRSGRDKKESVERSLAWAGGSIVTSGATVVLAFGTLAVASFGMLRSIGLAVMLGISVALLVALTLVPSALMVFGDRLFWPGHIGAKREKREEKRGYYAKAAGFTARHSKIVLLLALVISVPATVVVFSSGTSHDFIAQIPDSLESRAGYNSMVQGFGPGAVTPTYTIILTPVQLDGNNWINVVALNAISYAENSTLRMPGVSKVYGPTHPLGNPISYSSFNQLGLAEQLDMIRSMKPFLGQDGKSAMVWAVLSSEPYSDSAISTLNSIRANVKTLQSQSSLLASSTMLVGGETASLADLTSAASADYSNMTILVLVGVFAVLLFALGSVFTPLRLILTILLSVSWAMAAVMLISQNILGAQLTWILPIMLLVIMVGLGLDYDIFLVTRIRELVLKGLTDDAAIDTAVERTGAIITACGLVTAGAFSTMMLSHILLLQQLGLAILIVVLLDALVIRIYLVPSIMRHMKRFNWWAPRIIKQANKTIDRNSGARSSADFHAQ
jgi:putative drug exporter of the RND superfamily